MDFSGFVKMTLVICCSWCELLHDIDGKVTSSYRKKQKQACSLSVVQNIQAKIEQMRRFFLREGCKLGSDWFAADFVYGKILSTVIVMCGKSWEIRLKV